MRLERENEALRDEKKSSAGVDERCVFTPVKSSKHTRVDRRTRVLTRASIRERLLPDNTILLVKYVEFQARHER